MSGKIADLETWLGWCSRAERWLRIDNFKPVENSPELLRRAIYCLEDEAIQGEQLARLLPPSSREAALRIVVRLDGQSIVFCNALLAKRRPPRRTAGGRGT